MVARSPKYELASSKPKFTQALRSRASVRPTSRQSSNKYEDGRCRKRQPHAGFAIAISILTLANKMAAVQGSKLEIRENQGQYLVRQLIDQHSFPA